MNRNVYDDTGPRGIMVGTSWGGKRSCSGTIAREPDADKTRQTSHQRFLSSFENTRLVYSLFYTKIPKDESVLIRSRIHGPTTEVCGSTVTVVQVDTRL